METWSSLAYCLVILSLTWSANSQYESYVKTPSGSILGSLTSFNDHIILQYLGIPYAKPPLGELRFKKTQPVDPWSETLRADHFSPACIQYSEHPLPWNDVQYGISEDCLYLNIWVPRSSLIYNRKIPVMFWIHGGGYISGSSRKPVYNGQALAAIGEIIVVTINYRLNAFGFFTSGTDSAPGNVASKRNFYPLRGTSPYEFALHPPLCLEKSLKRMVRGCVWHHLLARNKILSPSSALLGEIFERDAMYDVLEALKWVNKNIAAFGGDPNQLTIAGESAGAWTIGLLCVSPLSTGLFHRVIMESGSPVFQYGDNVTNNFVSSQKLAEALGCADEINSIYLNPDNVVQCMKGVDAIEIARAFDSIFPIAPLPFFPNFGDEFLPLNARLAIINGQFHNVDVLIGNNLDEGTFLTTLNSDVFGYRGEKNPQINKTFGEMTLRSNFSSTPNSEAIVQHYLGNVREDDHPEVLKQISEAMGDFILVCPTVYFAERYSQAGNNVYFYLFVHRPSTTPWAEWVGTAHYEEVQFVFGLPLQRPEKYTDEEIFLSNRMIRVWTNWVKTGIPPEPNWPLYSRENPIYVTMDTKFYPRYGEGPHKNNCDFFRMYLGFT